MRLVIRLHEVQRPIATAIRHEADAEESQDHHRPGGGFGDRRDADEIELNEMSRRCRRREHNASQVSFVECECLQSSNILEGYGC